jgi:hypothetical protein
MYATGGDCSRSVASFRRFGSEPVIIGQGDSFSWQGRVTALYRWCREHPRQTVMQLDAFDTCCVSPIPADLSCDGVLFSAEANCWPDAGVAELYPPCPTRYRFLNAGAWLANTDNFVAFVEQHGLLSGVSDDQGAYTAAFLAGAAIRLDHECEVFHNLYRAQDDVEIRDGIYRVKSTGTVPLVVHGNGGSGIGAIWQACGV